TIRNAIRLNVGAIKGKGVARENKEIWDEFIKISKKIQDHEKTPDRRMSEKEVALMKKDWKAYSRSRGYSEEEIADFQRMLDLHEVLKNKGFTDDELSTGTAFSTHPERVIAALKGTHNIDQVDFDADGKKAVEAFVKEIKDPVRQQRVLKALDWYYDLDPENLSYVHHTVLRDNQRQFHNMIRDFINGTTPRGEKVADPFMEALLSKRKMPTLRSLIEAGYRIEENYLNILNGTMRYAYTKKINETIADQWKDSYIKGFLDAYRVSKETKNPENLIAWFRENSGYFYVPAKSELGMMDKRLKEISQRMKIIENKTDETYIRLQKEQSDITTKMKAMKLLRSTYTGKLKDRIAEVLLGSDVYIPGNFNSFIHDKGSKGLDPIYAGIKTKVEDMRSANITNYDGLYFNRVLWKGLRSFVFKNDGLPKDYKYSFQRSVMNFYDRTNRFLKIIRFYKPTIIAMNDLMQAGMANPAFIKYLPWAFRAYLNRNERDAQGNLTESAKTVQDAERKNVFNPSVGMAPILSEGSKQVAKIMGRPGFLGKLREDVGLEKTVYGKLATGMKDLWRGQQEVTWGLDGIIRLSVYRAMLDKFKGTYDPERAKLMAAEWTNLFLVKYSRIPTATRQVLNRFGFVLNYRIQTLRMYKEMV
ncbi:MAG: hypothetical protein KAJ19_24730, partial [Gammaproteobacteria bacterium]|nr:hypothetical protein [Gammaproteobacteria bacterium]